MSLAEIGNALREARITHMVAMGSISVWIYDYFLVLSDEIDLVWHSKWTLVKFIYIAARVMNPIFLTVSRYFDLSTDHTSKQCRLLFGLSTSLGFIEGLLLCDAVMYLQVYAFSQCNKWVGIYLMFQWVAAVITGVTLQAILFSTSLWLPLGIPELHCVPIKINLNLLAAIFSSSIPQWGMLVMITLWIMYRKYRQLKSSVLTALLRDGLIYMYGMFAFCIATTIITYEAPPGLRFIIGVPKSVFLNILVSRLILHLRRAARAHTEHKTIGGYTNPTKSFTGIHFAPRYPPGKGMSTIPSSVGSGSTYVDAAIVL
ncbi:hypothetical protein CC2G_009844 [Coprinopsis cinerea AmutBmut pab1-1]|nr:hypothetical protein CC2G_009844 [Coprinopsis cinerea AmutBmut pab1-1]